MIYIEERKPNKLTGLSSLFITFPYRQDIVDIIKQSEQAIFDKKLKGWEVPTICFKRLVKILAQMDELTVSVLPTTIHEDIVYELHEQKTKAFKHQEEAVQYGLNHDRWLLLDAPGLGKSKSIIDLANEIKIRDNIEHCLIICGINTLKSNWLKEISVHSNLSAKILGQKISKTGKISFGGVKERLDDLNANISEFFVITNIETLRNDDVVKAINNGKNKFDMIVVDECHVCKDSGSQQGRNLLKLNKAKYRIAMTGTLLLNSPLDSFVPLKFIGIENATATNFKYFYCKFTGPFHNILNGYKNIEVLKDELSTCSLRRTKDLLNLPEKVIIDEELDLNPEHKTFYENITKGITDQVDKVKLTTSSLLAMVIRLRQATACPSYLTTEDIPSTKIERACEIVEQVVNNGNKIVIFSTFKETTRILQEKLKYYNPLVCTGDTKDSIVNNNNIDLFQNDDNYKVFIATWKKMGTGITLTAANYEIFIDTPWTHGVYEQAQDRCHRIGTKNTVFIYNLICKYTIDERVQELVNTKRAFSDYVVDDNLDATTINSLREYITDLH